MYADKKVLLIGGGGTIGTYVAKELLEMGCAVDIICLEDYTSDNEKLRYFKQKINLDSLKEFLADKYYDGILDFLHHPVPEDYIDFHMVIAPKTDHEIFFSSIRAMADLQHPYTEESTLFIDLIEDERYKDMFDSRDGRNFIANDDYSLSKGRCERYLKEVSKYKNWTIVRPMVNTSEKRLDIILHTFHQVLDIAKAGETMYEPEMCRNLVAGLEWAGNTGKMIANLMFKKECMGQTYMLSTGHRMTWGEVADVYAELLGVKVEWVSVDEYRAKTGKGWGDSLLYDRNYSREVDNTKLLRDTGLTKEDFTPFKEGIRTELKKLGAI